MQPGSEEVRDVRRQRERRGRPTLIPIFGVLVLAIGVVTWQAESAARTARPATLGAALPLASASGRALDGSLWNRFIASNGSHGVPWNTDGRGGSSVANAMTPQTLDYDLPRQIDVSGGNLQITATRAPTLGQLAGRPHTFTWRSGIVSSYGKYEFLGGTVSVVAKMPTADGMWPAVWLLPGPTGRGGDNYEIDIFEGGYLGSSRVPADNYWWALHNRTHTVGAYVDLGVNLAKSYHTYSLKWVPGRSLTWYFDGEQIAKLTSAQAPIPNVPMQLILSLSVASPAVASFHSVPDASTPATEHLDVRSINIAALP